MLQLWETVRKLKKLQLGRNCEAVGDFGEAEYVGSGTAEDDL